MPLYEFECSECETYFEDLVRSNMDFTGVLCPSCGSDNTRKRLSTFAQRITGASNSFSTSSGLSSTSCSGGST